MLRLVFRLYLVGGIHLVDDLSDTLKNVSLSLQNVIKDNKTNQPPDEQVTSFDKIYIYSVGGDGLIDFKTGVNGEETNLNHYKSQAKPFYAKKVNAENGLILATTSINDKLTKKHQTLDISWATGMLTTWEYHGKINQIIYFKPIDECKFRIVVNDACLFWNESVKVFGTSTCEGKDDNKNYEFKIFKDDEDLAEEIENKVKLLSISKKEYENAIEKLEL